jgi:hypothetical protein
MPPFDLIVHGGIVVSAPRGSEQRSSAHGTTAAIAPDLKTAGAKTVDASDCSCCQDGRRTRRPDPRGNNEGLRISSGNLRRHHNADAFAYVGENDGARSSFDLAH